MPKSATSINKRYLVAIIAIFVLALIVIVIKFCPMNKHSSNQSPIFAGENGLKTANYHSLNIDQNDPKYPYLTSFQIKYPANYFVTDYSTYNYFRTQGGGGFPTMVLTKGAQFTNPFETEDHAFDELMRSGTDCITIRNYLLTDPNEGFSETIKVNGNDLMLKTVEFKLRRDEDFAVKYYDAILKLPEDVIYEFQTCNLNNKDDLMTVINNFAVRGTQN